MSGYCVSILRRAQRELTQLSSENYDRVREAILSLAESPRPAGCLRLTGRDGWRIRVGSYRVVYEIDDSEQRVVILHVGHRRDVYR
ncbi:MAG: type II toxin-antitoxin system RelE/ParE family toxin [Chloroflexi bacterium]|nr:type II toxin-antitoxin system RelE/ParE family toxin [Chloroflexota bacterium]